ncbi:TPA: alpha/beta fold hydrolase [Acinetobacter baumannii]
MIRKSNSLLKILFSSICLISGSAMAAPITDLSKQIVSEKPGSILSIAQQDVTDLFPHANQRLLVNYRSRGVNNEPIVASAFILLPKGTPPKNGWPILAWAHGTTGVADTCAPSGDYAGGPVHSYQEVASKALDGWLARGYAVVAPDYQGLGTLGAHPYMNAKSQLHTVVDAVRALHMLKPKDFNKQWLVMGHSQGGAAAITVAAYGQKDAPELDLKGAIALAPGGYQYEGIAEYVKTNPNPEPSVAAFFPIVLLGAQAAEPSIIPENLVSPEMGNVLTQARSRCLPELQSDLKKSPSSIFRPNVDLKPLLSYLKQQSIENMVPTVPLMIVQGSKDHLVDPRGTYAYYQQLCKSKKPTIYQTIDGGDHRDALRQSNTFATDFLNAIEKKQAKSYCSNFK